MSEERFAGAGEDEDFAFLDAARERQAAGPARPGETPGRATVERRRRRRAKTGKRSDPENYTQVSAWVRREIKASFDVARAQEAADRGRAREQAEVIESLMRFYVEEGDPWEILGAS